MEREFIYLVYQYDECTDLLLGCHRDKELAKQKHAECPTCRYIKTCLLE